MLPLVATVAAAVYNYPTDQAVVTNRTVNWITGMMNDRFDLLLNVPVKLMKSYNST